ncbi:alpha/beta hydrolase [Thermoleophilia bacterium SCSIO 60948]|nr:alpha/beta hydrolase [Thermoleophilia bacterium SCSIO 60948]
MSSPPPRKVAPAADRDPAAADEVRALGRRAFGELREAIGGIGTVHRAISDRSFAATGGLGAPIKLIHDAIAHGVYTAIRAGNAAAGAAGDAYLSRRAASPEEVSANDRGAQLLAIVNGLIGDELVREGSELASPMSIRSRGARIAPESEALERAFPAAGPRVVVFLHGLFETEAAWRFAAAERGGTYLDLVRDELGATAIPVRFNTGLRISENGRLLSGLLDRLVAQWPCEIEEIALVGHSMGGLVARSACHYAAPESHDWTDRVRHVVSLGTPHYGSPVEGSVHVAAAALDVLPETRPFSRFLRRRSGGIRDLRSGSIVDEDWIERDPDELRRVVCEEVPLLPGATHCFVAATITESPDHPLGRLLGDTLVLSPSASGIDRDRRIGFEAENGLRLGRCHHLALLNHPVVARRLVEWLSTPPERIPDRVETATA